MTNAVVRGRTGRILLAAATAAYLVALARVTLVEDDAAGAGGILLAWAQTLAELPVTRWITFDVLEFTANIALFVPAGLLGALWWRRYRWLAVPTGLALSATIELVQAFALTTRVADVRDLVSNTLGAAVGAALVIALRSRTRRRSAGQNVVVP